MTTLTRTRRRVSLREGLARTTQPLRVDQDQGIIYGVKILGWDSDNGRKYLPEAGRAAVPLYEGARVFLNHPAKKDATARDDEDAFGRLHNVTWTPEGVFGDLHFYTTHPMAARVCEDASKINSLGVFGLSHNAQGEGETVDGIFVIHRIVEVRSVDLVSEPATVKNLKESRKMANRLREADQEEPNHRDHVLKAMNACLEDEDMDPDEKYQRVKDLHDIINPKPKATEEADDDEPAETERVGGRRMPGDNNAASTDSDESRRFRSGGLTESEVAAAFSYHTGATGFISDRLARRLHEARGSRRPVSRAPLQEARHEALPSSSTFTSALKNCV
jgi:hypothetical protein